MRDPVVEEIIKRMDVAKGVDLDEWADADEAQHIYPASEFEADVWTDVTASDEERGAKLPWNKTHNDARIRNGELSVWAGRRGAGKSLITSQVMLGLMAQGQPCVIASPEMPIPKTLGRMMTMALGEGNPTREFAHEFFRWCDGRLFVYQGLGTIPARRLLGLSRYAITQLGIKHVVIDSLMMAGFGEAGNSRFKKDEEQALFVRELAAITRDHGGHIHLVAHMRKSQNGSTRMDADDVAGAGGITDVASCVYIVEENRKRAEEMKKPESDRKPDIVQQGDVRLTVEKNRFGPAGGRFALWRTPSLQFVGGVSHKARCMIEVQGFGY